MSGKLNQRAVTTQKKASFNFVDARAYYAEEDGTQAERKRAMREESERLIAEFLAKGGKVTRLAQTDYNTIVKPSSQGYIVKAKTRAENFKAKFGSMPKKDDSAEVNDGQPPF